MTPVALIVSEDPWRVDRWARWLEPAGFATLTCPSHLAWGCPREFGDPCPRRELADVAVVDVACGPGEPSGRCSGRLCTKLPGDGGTVFVHSCGAPEANDARGIDLHHPVDPPRLMDAVTDAWHRARTSLTPSNS